MALDGNQDALIDAVAARQSANGGRVSKPTPAVLMPWAARVPAILEAWYPGHGGRRGDRQRADRPGEPVGPFAGDLLRFEKPSCRGRCARAGKTGEDSSRCHYSEGAAVGYKWFDAKKLQPLVPVRPRPFLHELRLWPDQRVPAPNGRLRRPDSRVRNSGKRAGMAVGQVYASPASGGWEAPKRLVGFAKGRSCAGRGADGSVDVDPRLLATFDEAAQRGASRRARTRSTLGASSRDICAATTTVTLPALTLPSNWRPGQAAAAPAPQPGERGR